MKKRTVKNILIIIIIFIVIASTCGYFFWNKPHANIRDAKGIETNAIALYAKFISDSAMANATYANTILNVSGIIKNVSHNQQNQQVILLKTMEAAASVNCTMEGNASGVKPGDDVSLKGLCIGYIAGDAEMGIPGDVFIVSCDRSRKTSAGITIYASPAM